jgi:hypothetical protein
MGMMDKMKQQASTLAEKTQELAGKTSEGAKAATAQAQDKLSEVQERRRTDQLLHDLGAAYLAERQEQGSPENKERIEQLVGELTKSS